LIVFQYRFMTGGDADR